MIRATLYDPEAGTLTEGGEELLTRWRESSEDLLWVMIEGEEADKEEARDKKEAHDKEGARQGDTATRRQGGKATRRRGERATRRQSDRATR